MFNNKSKSNKRKSVCRRETEGSSINNESSESRNFECTGNISLQRRDLGSRMQISCMCKKILFKSTYVKEKRVTKIEWIIKKKNLKMNETEKEQMMKQMNGNLQNKLHK